MRFGAGRPGYKVKVEQLHRVDVRVLHRRSYLKAGQSFTWAWNRGGEPTGSIGVQVLGADALALQYMVGIGKDRRDGSQTIRLDHTRCNYGNTRPWFVCPACQRRAGLLFLRWGRFACRHCQRVAYTSQSSDVMDRMWRKQSKIEARLGEHWQRPKGMRQQTYERLMGKLLDCEARREEEFVMMAGRLLNVGV